MEYWREIVVGVVGSILVVWVGYLTARDKWGKLRVQEKRDDTDLMIAIGEAQQKLKKAEVNDMVTYFKMLSDERKSAHEADVKRLETDISRVLTEFRQFRTEAGSELEGLRDAERRCQIEMAQIKAFARQKGWRERPRDEPEAE
jgi:hypothetical protein